MEILKDILSELKGLKSISSNQEAEMNALKKEILDLKLKMDNPRKVELDVSKVSGALAEQSQNLNNSAKSIHEDRIKIQEWIANIPREVTITKKIDVALNPKILFLAVILSIVFGYWVAPEIEKSRIEHREKQIEEFKKKNPKLGEKYFFF